MDQVVSTTEAAALLRVSPQRVRVLWQEGSLTGRKMAGRVILDRASLMDFAERERPPTRPLSARNAWTLLMLLDGVPTPWATPPEIARLRRLAFTRDAPALAALVRSRARTVHFDGPRGIGSHLVKQREVAASGVTLAPRWTDLVADAVTEVYAEAARVAALQRDLQLWPAAAGALVVHSVPTSASRVLNGRAEMPAPVVAVDLLESGEPRSERAGKALWTSITEKWRATAPPLRVRRESEDQ
ncbi:MAG: helix-turn-helix domain-containing protein [Kineosporiaceae bacterium]